MKFTKSVLAASALLLSTSVFATPVYYGNTTSATPLAPDAISESVGVGYFLWNDTSSPLDWSLRWTNDLDPDQGGIASWFGSITFRDSNLGITSEVTFENTEDVLAVSYDSLVLGGMDALGFTSITNNAGGIDGINFSLTENQELMVFSLGSSLFSVADADLCSSDSCAVDATNIYIGDGLAAPKVFTSNVAGGTLQSFEITVPEPSIIALFGLGLIGMGIATRRRKV